MSPADPGVVEFGPFRFDQAHRLLTAEGMPVPLGDRALDILQVLIAHAPNIVTKATLFEQVWPDTFVEESTLRFQMWGLRKALGDGESGNRYISTVSGRGYCFVAPLLAAQEASAPDAGLQTRVLIVDDHPFLREGLKAVLRPQGDIAVVGEAADGAEAVTAFRALLPDITLMDLQMPTMDGVAAIAEIRRDYPKARIIVLTTYGGDAQALQALKAGAAGYLLKSTARKELLDAIQAVRGGHRYLPPEIALHAVDDLR